jgi:hypothetical protein
MRRRVEGLAPKHFTEWDTKRSAGARYDIEYLNAVGMAEACGDRLDYFTMSSTERVRALVQAGYLSKDDGTTLENALVLFTRVEHFIELQEMTHPGSEEKAARVQRTVERTLASLDPDLGDPAALMRSTKNDVRRVYGQMVGGTA